MVGRLDADFWVMEVSATAYGAVGTGTAPELTATIEPVDNGRYVVTVTVKSRAYRIRVKVVAVVYEEAPHETIRKEALKYTTPLILLLMREMRVHTDITELIPKKTTTTII